MDVAHDAIIRADDCQTSLGIKISRSDKRQASFEARIVGRILHHDVKVPKSKKILLKKGQLLSEDKLEILKGIEEVIVRSPLTCALKYGLCVNCYGLDMSTKTLVEKGTPVGIIGAQSIGEPGTQLTMRVRHAGGIVGLDVTQGIPRVEELFEARTPKYPSPIAEIAGKIKIEETDQSYLVTVKTTTKPREEKTYHLPLTSVLKVQAGDLVDVGRELRAGPLDIKQVLEVRGLR